MGRTQAEIYEILVERADRAGIAAYRARLAQELEGSVLEIGCGTGRMFSHYPVGAHVTAIEPDGEFREHAEQAAEGCVATIEVRGEFGEALPFEPESFDAVIFASVLCSVGDVDRTLSEAHRVLKRGGELRALEHVRSERWLPGLMMDLANPLWRLYNRQGCNMNRRLEPAVRRAGFEIEAAEAFQVYVPGLPAFPSRLLRARANGPAVARSGADSSAAGTS